MHVYDIEMGDYVGDAPVEIVSGGGPWAIASDGSYSYTFTGTTTNNPDWYPDFDPQNSLSVTMSTEFYKTGADTPLATDSQTVTIYPG
ncbi:MAG: hypothetical protein K6F56_06855 [Oscillospiraceae bacterium]|nr:hypothetical protein [Oscillospiraceae bacterium]